MMNQLWIVAVAGLLVLVAAQAADAQERQVTSSVKNHHLDNNDNFSPDGRFLCYDTREMYGPGIENSQSIEQVELATGAETVLYTPAASVTGRDAAPGVGAASYRPDGEAVAFIHGPPLDEVPTRGYYAKPNRNGAEVATDGSGRLTWLDKRDVATDRDTLPGAHRGGTHRHEYSLDGRRIGFTYDDWLLPEYGRTIGYMERRFELPDGASHYFALLVPVVPKGTAKPGEFEQALGDSWVGRQGLMRAFIGTVRAADGVSYEQSLFVVDVPENVDITTADSGSATRFPQPPKGTRIRRLTHDYAEGTVRGTVAGDRIAYYGRVGDNTLQVFIIPSDGSDRDPDAAKRPVQASHFPDGAGPGLRWHPSGNTVFCTSNNAVAATCVRPGPDFGKSVYLTPQDDGPERFALVCSPDGSRLAFNRTVPTFNAKGERETTYNGLDFTQIFVVDFPDADGDGIADADRR